MSKPVLNALIALRDFFNESYKWTQGAMAMDGDGAEVDAHHPLACCWCLLGGLEVVYGDVRLSKKQRLEVLDSIVPTPLHRDKFLDDSIEQELADAEEAVWEWNDDCDTTFDEVRNQINSAIEQKAAA